MDIIHQFKINASVEAVYEALTSEKGYNGWWSKDCQIGTKAGDPCTLRFNKEGTIVEMGFEIKALKTNEAVIWTCVQNPNSAWLGTILDFFLKGEGVETAFQFTHGGWDPKWEGHDAYEMTKDGWKHFMESIRNYCEAGKGSPW